MAFSALMMVMLLFGGSNAGDLLDYTPTEMYWEMRDQRVVDFDTMSAVLADEDATATDTLMAIRAIGEWTMIQEADPDIQADPADKAKALKVLAPYVGSKAPFVDEYAKRSIAWIKGVEPDAAKTLPAEVYDLDLALLPSDATVVGQMKITNGVGPINFAELIPDIKMDGQSMREMMVQQMLPGILQGVQMIGNARVDLVTTGVMLNDKDNVSFMLIARGQYDRVAVQLAMEEATAEDDNTSFYSVGEIEVIAVDSHDPVAILMPSDELFVVMFSEQRGAKLPIDAVAKKLGQADRKPAFDAVIAKQVDAIERDKADIWMALRVTDLMKEEREIREMLGAFDVGRATAVIDTEGIIDIKWHAEGSDADTVAKTAEHITDQVKEGKAEIKEQMNRRAEMKVMFEPLLKMMDSMQFNAQGKTMTGGMKVDSKLGAMMPMMMFGIAPVHHNHNGGVEFAEDAVEEAVEE